MDEEKDKLRRSNRSTRDKVKLYSARLLINVVVIATLGATGYVIYLAQQYTNQVTKHFHHVVTYGVNICWSDILIKI